MQLRLNQLQQRINKKDVGLHATVSYQENLKSPIVDPEEIVIFKRRAIAGLDWDVLNNGFYENRIKNKVLTLQRVALEKQQQTQNLYAFQNKQTTQIIFYFNSKKIEILDARKQLNNKQMPIIEKLWAIKHITKDNYLKAIQNTTDINAQYNLYQNYNQVNLVKNTFEFELPILDININHLLQKVNGTTFDSTLIDATQIAKYQSSYLKDISLKAYTRYNYYDVYNAGQPNRSYISVGMNLSLPLAFNQKDKKEFYFTQYQLSNLKETTDSIDAQAFILNKYYEYQYKLKQFKNLYHKRLVFEELLRTERVKAQLSDFEFNPNTALFILDDYWSNAIELIDLKQDLYKLLLDIKTRLPSANIIDYTTPLNLSNLNIASSNPPFKAVYVWSDAFKNNSQTVINEYCKVNEFNPLLISYNSTKNYVQQISEFISKNYTTPIHIMIGSNKLLNIGVTGFLDTLKMNLNLSQIKGIHLDIEPHTFVDFKDNKELYFKKYIDVLKQAKQFADNNKLELSVSIPLNYPDEVLTEINAVCSLVYLMAYENVDIDFISRKTVEEKAILKNKCVLALRTKDFENRTSMDDAFKKLGFEKTAYHDLDDLIKFDNSSINVKGEGEK
jgi:energy-converting hydrogenase A subunit M